MSWLESPEILVMTSCCECRQKFWGLIKESITVLENDDAIAEARHLEKITAVLVQMARDKK